MPTPATRAGLSERRRLRTAEPFASVDDVVAGLEALASHTHSRDGRSDPFAVAYLRITTVLRERLRDGRFHNPPATARYTVTFANRYRRALHDWDRGRRRRVPRPWRMAFDSTAPDAPPLLPALLGINAHINYDLPFTVLEARLDVGCRYCHGDHLRINDALRQATPAVRRRIAAAERPRLSPLLALAGPWLDRKILVALRSARERAWSRARALAAASSPAQRRRIETTIERQAVLTAVRITDSSAAPLRACALLAAPP